MISAVTSEYEGPVLASSSRARGFALGTPVSFHSSDLMTYGFKQLNLTLNYPRGKQECECLPWDEFASIPG